MADDKKKKLASSSAGGKQSAGSITKTDKGGFEYASREQLIECPYDETHYIPYSQYLVHVTECRKKYLESLPSEADSKIHVCKYDELHHIPDSIYQSHLAACPKGYNKLLFLEASVAALSVADGKPGAGPLRDFGSPANLSTADPMSSNVAAAAACDKAGEEPGPTASKQDGKSRPHHRRLGRCRPILKPIFEPDYPMYSNRFDIVEDLRPSPLNQAQAQVAEEPSTSGNGSGNPGGLFAEDSPPDPAPEADTD